MTVATTVWTSTRLIRTPRLVIAAPRSGEGKTTITTGIVSALRNRGRRVAPFKVGPDYIDPAFLTRAAGRPARNLDLHLLGSKLAGLFAHGAEGADIAIVEGVMGLFDGMGSDQSGSTAHIARLLAAPVLLVVDAAAQAASVAATVAGFAGFDPHVEIAGVILNRVGSDRHEEILRAALASWNASVPVLGALRRDDELNVPSRHLGLIPAVEDAARADGYVKAAARVVGERIDLGALEAIAAGAPELASEVWSPASASPHLIGGGMVVGLAAGRAFSFVYPEVAEMLEGFGATVASFDPTRDETLPANCSAVYIGGGFPEVYADDLAANEKLRAELRRFAGAGGPVVAECGGLLYLARRLEGRQMVGVLPASARMTPTLTIGYRVAEGVRATLLSRPDEVVHGHEFHRTALERSDHAAAPWRIDGRREGFGTANVHASYIHVHWAAYPDLAHRFLTAAENYRTESGA